MTVLRKRFLLSFVSLLVVLLAAATVFVATFDLNDYRRELASALSDAIGSPVTLSAARLGLVPRPGVVFEGVRVGRDGGEFVLSAERMQVQFSLRGLLVGRLDLDALTLRRPELQITVGGGRGRKRKVPQEPRDLLEESTRFSLTTLKVWQGGVQVRTVGDGTGADLWSLHELDLTLDNLRIGERVESAATAVLSWGGREVPVELSGHAGPLRAGEGLSAVPVQLVLRAGPVELSEWWGLTGVESATLTGTAGIKTVFRGRWEEGLEFDLELAGTALQLRGVGSSGAILPLSAVTARGLLRSEGESLRVENGELRLGPTLLAGRWNLDWQRDGATRRGTVYSKGRVDLQQVAALCRVFSLPGGEVEAGGAATVEYQLDAVGVVQSKELRLESATLVLPGLSLEASGSWGSGAERRGELRLRAWADDLGALVSRLPRWRSLELSGKAVGSLSLNLANGGVRVESGELSLDKVGFAPPGGVTPPITGSAELAFSPEGATLRRADLQMGRSTVSATGALRDWSRPEVSVDVADARLWLADFGVDSALSGPMKVSGRFRSAARHLDLETLRVTLPHGDVATLSGSFWDWGRERVQLTVSSAYLDLSRVLASLPAGATDGGRQTVGQGEQPALGPVELAVQVAAGQVGGIEFHDLQAELEVYRGRLTLRNAAVRWGFPRWQVSAVSGEGVVADGVLRVGHAEGLIGAARVALSGWVGAWNAGGVNLQLTAEDLRARDLLLPGGDAEVRRLSGQVVASGAGLELTGARLTLPGGTDLQVDGTLRNWADPRGRFQVIGPELHLQELLGLFRGAPAADDPGRAPSVPGEWRVDVAIEGGTLGPVQFESLGGQMTLSGADIRLEDARLELHDPNWQFAQVRGHVVLEPGGLRISTLKGALGPGTFRVSGTVGKWESAGANLALDLEDVRASDLLLPAPNQSVDSIVARFRMSAAGIDLDNLTATLGPGTEVNVKGRVVGYRQPRTELHVQAPRIDLQEVLPLLRGGAEDKDRPGAEAPETAPEPPGSGRVTVEVDAGLVWGAGAEDLSAQIDWGDGVLELSQLEFRLAGGAWRATGTYDPRANQELPVSLEGSVEGADPADLERFFLRREPRISGRLSATTRVRMPAAPSAWSMGTIGSLSFRVVDGVIRGSPLLHSVLSVADLGQIAELRLPTVQRQGMAYDELQATLNVDRGVFRTEDLLLKSPSMDASAIGSVDLSDHSLQGLVAVRPLKSTGELLSKIPLAGWVLTGEEQAIYTMQFRVSGTVDAPRVRSTPVASLSDKTVGIFKRVLRLPGHVIRGLIPETEKDLIVSPPSGLTPAEFAW